MNQGNPDALKVQVPLVPIVWDLLSQWVTREAKWFVRTGEMPPVSSVADEEKPERAVADLSGKTVYEIGLFGFDCKLCRSFSCQATSSSFSSSWSENSQCFVGVRRG
jgi:hypothetical protein